MDKKSTILLYVMGILILVSVGVTFYRYMILKDYQVITEIECNPEIENCFVRTEEDGTISYYKIISRNAANIPLCDPAQDESCRALVCEAEELKCEITFCSPKDTPEGETCSR